MELIPALRQCLSGQPTLQQAILFGSVAKGTATANSDIDLAVQAATSLSATLRQAIIEEVTLLTGRPVDLVDLAVVGEPLLNQIVTTGVRLLGSDTAFASLMMRNVIANADFVPLQQRLLKERLKLWINN